MNTESSYAVTLFYCYAREDEWLLKEPEKHLAPLKRQGYLNGWYDRQIEAGMEWKQEIDVRRQ